MITPFLPAPTPLPRNANPGSDEWEPIGLVDTPEAMPAPTLTLTPTPTAQVPDPRLGSSWEPAPLATPDEFGRDIANPFQQGVLGLSDAVAAVHLMLGTRTPEEFARQIVENDTRRGLIPQHPDDVKFNAEGANLEGWDQVAHIASNPRLWLQTAVQSLPASAPSLVGGAAGGIAAGPAGAVVGAGAGSFITEFNASLVDALREASPNGGVNASDLAAAINDPAIMGRAKDFAVKRGIPVAIFDGLSMGLAGKVFEPVAKAAGGKLIGNILGGTAEAAMQGTAGAAGEVGAQLASIGEVKNYGDAALEFAGEVPGAITEHIAKMPGHALDVATGRTRAPVLPENPAPVPTEPVVQPNVQQGVDPNDWVPIQPEAPAPQAPDPFVSGVSTPTTPVAVQPVDPVSVAAAPGVSAEGPVAAPAGQVAAPVQPEPAPAKPEGVAFVLTNATRQKLRQLGYPAEAIRNMTPAQGNSLVADGTPFAGPTESQPLPVEAPAVAPAPETPPSATTEAPAQAQPAPTGPDAPTQGRKTPAPDTPAAQGTRAAPTKETTLARYGHAVRRLEERVKARAGMTGAARKKALETVQDMRSSGYRVLSPADTPTDKKGYKDYTKNPNVFGVEDETPQQYRIGDSITRRGQYQPDTIIGVHNRNGEVSLTTTSENTGGIGILRGVRPDEIVQHDAQDDNATAVPPVRPKWYGQAEKNSKGVKPGDTVTLKNGTRGKVVGVWKSGETTFNRDTGITKPINVAIQPDGAAEGTYKMTGLDGIASTTPDAPAPTPAEPPAETPAPAPVPPPARAAGADALPEGTIPSHRGREFAVGDIVRFTKGSQTREGRIRIVGAASKNSPKGWLHIEFQTGHVKGYDAGGTYDPGDVTEVLPPKHKPRVGPVEAAPRVAPPDEQDGAELDEDVDNAEADELRDDRRPRGTLAPHTQDVSYTNRASVFGDAWRAAGLDPDEGALLPPAQKINLLRKLLTDTFGFKSVSLGAGRTRIATPDAFNQMLDAFRNVQFMMHVLGLPVRGVSLGGTLTLALERDQHRYFGVYRPATREIGLPGRSNSFAHEWAHALDHYLMDALNKLPSQARARLLSQAARAGELDVANSIEEAFAKLINAMFYKNADLAARVLDLERAAAAVHQNGPNAGKPTQAALAAQGQLARIMRGASFAQIVPSDYRKASQDYQPGSPYWASVHEMLARAFEAYVAHRMAAAGGTNEFVTKGEEAYLSDADARLAMTFPKGDDRLRIFRAFDEVFDHLRSQQVLGAGAAAGRPDDGDILDPQHWNKLALAAGEPGVFAKLRQEGFAIRNRAARLFRPGEFGAGVSQMALNAGINTKALPQRVLDRVLDTARFFLATSRAYMNARIRRNSGRGAEFMSFVWDRFATQPGHDGPQTGPVFEEEREREALKIANEIESLLKANGKRSSLSKADGEVVRELLYGGKPAGSTPELVRIAAGLRRIMERVHAGAKAAGIEIGYVEDKGYLPRVLRTDRVQQDPAKFEAAARDVYLIVYDRLTSGITPDDMLELARATAARKDPLGTQRLFAPEIAALRQAVRAHENAVQRNGVASPALEAALSDALDTLRDEVRDTFAEVAARDWRTAVQIGDSATYEAHGPASSFTKHRTLPSEADDIMRDWYETDPLALVMEYSHRVLSRSAYVKRAGITGGVDRLDDVIRRRDVKDAIRAKPGRYDPDTSAGRLAILRDLANTRTDNVLEIALSEAERAGAYAPDVVELRGLIESFAGRKTRGPMADMMHRLAGSAYTFTYMALLSQAAISSLTEPLTIMLRTGDLGVTFRTFLTYLSEAARASATVQQRAALARAIGLTTTVLHDAILLNRLEADSAQMFHGNRLLARFFRANLLSQITNAQRRAAMTGGFLWMQGLAQEHAEPKTSSARRKIIAAEFRELGVDDAQHADFMDWLTQQPGLPDLGELDSKAGALFTDAVSRFVDQVIQNPRRADKPVLTGNPVGAVVYSLTSFLYAFFANVHSAIAARAVREYDIRVSEGESAGSAAAKSALGAAGTFTTGFALIFAGQLVVSAAREAILNGEQWEKHRADDDLFPWLAARAFSRTGLLGPGDTIGSAVTGLMYERDLSNLFVGPGPAYVLSQMTTILRGAGLIGRNSPKTDTAERRGLEAAYRLFLAPLAAGALSAADVAGPLGSAARYAGLSYLSAPAAAKAFAGVLMGPENER